MPTFVVQLHFEWLEYHQQQDQPNKCFEDLNKNDTYKYSIVHTSMLVSRIGKTMTNTTHNMYDTGGKGISSASSLPPAASRQKIESKSKSPAVIDISLTREFPGVENGDLCIY